MAGKFRCRETPEPGERKCFRGLAGRQGVEPRSHGPEPCVLPLDDLPSEATPESSRPPAGFQRGRVLDSAMLLVLAVLAAASSPIPPASRQIVLSVSASWD